jgi:hypothetical protein
LRNLASIGESGMKKKTMIEYTTVSRPQNMKIICGVSVSVEIRVTA